MFQLYKQRNFSDIINDTFSFFRINGKNYFKNFIIVSGGLLLILMLLIYLVFDVVFINLFSGGLGSPGTQQMLDEYFAANIGLFIGAGIAGVLLILLITIVTYSYPIIYFKFVENNQAPTASQIFSAFRNRAGRIFIFGLLWLVTFLPIMFLLGLVSILLFATIIGIPVVFILFAAAFCWMFLSFYDYLNNDSGYLNAMGNGWNMLFKNFWGHSGATLIFFVIIFIIQIAINFVVSMIAGALIMFEAEGSAGPNQESLTALGIMALISFTLAMLVSYLIGNFTFVAQGMIYYSCVEDDENRSLNSEIDLIGSDAE